MSIFTFPEPASYGKNVPEQQTSVKQNAPRPESVEGLTNTLLLADFALFKNEDDIRACASRSLERAQTIDDPKLRRIVVFSLSKILQNPKQLAKFRAEHLKKISEHFEEVAFAAREGKRYEDALAAVQIAIRCDPENARARLLFASLIEQEKAIRTLFYGLNFLDVESEIAPAYFNKYFQLLSDLQQDRLVAKQTLSLLSEKRLPDPVRVAIANYAAMSLYWIGNYENCLRILEEQKVADTQQGMILKARSLFDLGKNKEAVDLLLGGVDSFPAEKRDAILSQLSRFYQRLGDSAGALSIAHRRVAENPGAPSPYLQRLYLYNKFNDKDRFASELASILETFPASQTALITLANFAAEHGKSDLAKMCLQFAMENRYPPNVFAATVIESLVTADRPEEAIETYIETTRGAPKLFSDMETALSAILAAAYLKIADVPELASDKKEEMRNQANILVAQYLSDKTLTPENFISGTNLFRRIRGDDFALRVALAGEAAFPWHSQLRANAISLRIKLGKISAGDGFASVQDEIRTLLNMRRPGPEIWREIALWLATAPNIPQSDIDELRHDVAPLVRSDLSADSFKEY